MEKLAADNLKRLYNQRKYGPERLTQRKLADLMGFSQQTAVSQYLTGRSALGVEAIAKFANALGVLPEDIRPDFYELLPIKQNTRSTTAIPVRESWTGAEIFTDTIYVLSGGEDLVSTYAVLVDNNDFRSSRIRKNAHLVLNENLVPLVDDDVYVVTDEGKKYIATYLGDDGESERLVRRLDTNEIVEIPLSVIRVFDVIVAVENPARHRDTKPAGD